MKISSLNFVWIGIVLILFCGSAAATISNEGINKIVQKSNAIEPCYNSDGTKVVFESDGEIWIADLQNKNEYKLSIPSSGPLHFPSWSPVDDKIIYRDDSSIPGRLFICSINANGADATPLTDGSYWVSRSSFSPNGQKIAYASWYNDGSTRRGGIWVMNVDGTNPVLLTSESNYNVDPSWSPDGTKIIFMSGVWPYTNIWIINTDGSNLRQLTFDSSEHIGRPSFSSDGTYIAYAKEDVGGVNPWNLWVMNADGSEQTKLLDCAGYEGVNAPKWHPKENKVLFSSNYNTGIYYLYEMILSESTDDFTVTEVSDGVMVTTPRVKYHLANGGFARELWIDHNGDGLYDENIAFEDVTLQYPYLAFGSWGAIIAKSSGGETYAGSVSGGTYSYNIVEETTEKIVVDFTSVFETTTATVRWKIYPNGDAKIIPSTSNPMENTYSLMYTWWVKPQLNDIVGMRLTPDSEITSTVTFTGSNNQIATPDFTKAIRTQADFSDVALSHPYQFYQDTKDDYTLLVVEPKASVEDDWEWTESSQANDALWGGRLSYDSTSNPLYYAAGLVDWAWYYDPAPEDGGTAEPRESPTTQPINQDKKFAFYVHWMWGDTNEEDRYAAAGDIAEDLAQNEPPVANAAPVIENIDVLPSEVPQGGTSIIKVIAYDADGDELTYSYDPSGGNINGDGAIITWTADVPASGAPPIVGTFFVDVTVSDGKSTDTERVYIDVTGEQTSNHAPIIQNVDVSPSKITQGESTTINVEVIDYDGDHLTYYYESSGGFISGSGSAVTWTADTAASGAPPITGNFFVDVIVSDGQSTDSERVFIEVVSETSEHVLVDILNPEADFLVNQGEPVVVKAKVTDYLENNIKGSSGTLVQATFTNGDELLELFDDGTHNDGNADDGVYANEWIPTTVASGYSETVCTIEVSAHHSTLGEGTDEVGGIVRTAGPDLEIKSISWEPQNPTEKDAINFSVVVKNVGTEPAENFHLSFLIDGQVSFSNLVSSVPAGSDSTQYFIWHSDRSGNLPIKAVADLEKETIDVNYENNEAEQTILIEAFDPSKYIYVVNLAIVPLNTQDNMIAHSKSYYYEIGQEVREYYLEVSYGTLYVNYEVCDVFTLPQKRLWYTYYGGDQIRGERAKLVVTADKFFEDAISVSDSKIDFTKYDYNPDNGQGIVAYITLNDIFNEGPFVGHSTGFGFYDTNENVKVDAIYLSETHYMDNIRSIAHEFAHSLGKMLITGIDRNAKDGSYFLPDLYLRGDVTQYWCLMGDYYYDQPIERVQLNTYSKEWLGWLEYADITKGKTYTVKSLNLMEYGDNVLTYTNPWSVELNKDFYILEHRTNDSRYSKWDTNTTHEKVMGIYQVLSYWDGIKVHQDNINLVGELTSPENCDGIFEDPSIDVSFTLTSIDEKEAKVLVGKYEGINKKGMCTTPTTNMFYDNSEITRNMYAQCTLPDLDLHAYSEDGNHVGVNYDTGEYEIEIPGTIASGDLINGREWIFVPDDIDVTFVTSSKDIEDFLEDVPKALELTDGVENYVISVVYYDSNGNRYESEPLLQDISPGQFVEQPYKIDHNVDGTYSVIVENVNNPPTAVISSVFPNPANENDLITFDASASYDADEDSLTYSWDLDNDGIFETDGMIVEKTWPDDYSGDIGLMVTDEHGASDIGSTTVTILNVPPEIDAIVDLPTNPIEISSTFNLNASFSDAGVLDTHTAVWNFGDGTTSAGIVTETNGAGTVTGEHTYIKAGIYSVTLTVTDDDGGSATATSVNYVVVYDPEGGFVTGGGWIDSPAGAYLADTTLVGKATFTLESKYKKDAAVPTDNTNFQFKTANLKFKSASCDWLVISGAQAIYQGTGTINGAGNYGFMLSAVDGAIKGDGIDKFRIKIWDKVSGEIVYDNQIGASEDAEPTTTIGGGSIVVHKVK